jgi:hypothetical protein
VRPIELRSGKNLPVAGARIVSSDGSQSVGFQLVAASPRAKRLDVVINAKSSRNSSRRTVAQVAAHSDIQFDLSLADSGKVVLVVNDKSFDIEFEPLSDASGMVFCSTAQFKFFNLEFSAS